MADVCFPDDDSDAARRRLTGPKELWHLSQSAPRATDGSGPQVTAREVLETQRQALAAYEELSRARRTFEASEQARHQALMIATYLFGMLGQAQAKVMELTRRIDALNNSALREKTYGHGLEQTLHRAEQQELELRTQLARAERDRDRAQKVADHAARRIDQLEAELAALRAHAEAAAPSGDTSGVLWPAPLPQPRSDDADLDAVDNALEKVRFVPDREYDAVQEAAEDLGLRVIEPVRGDRTIPAPGRTPLTVAGRLYSVTPISPRETVPCGHARGVGRCAASQHPLPRPRTAAERRLPPPSGQPARRGRAHTTHPLTLSARIAHAADLRGLRDRRQAEKVEQEALSELESTLGKQHVDAVSARFRNRPYWDFEPQVT